MKNHLNLSKFLKVRFFAYKSTFPKHEVSLLKQNMKWEFTFVASSCQLGLSAPYVRVSECEVSTSNVLHFISTETFHFLDSSTSTNAFSWMGVKVSVSMESFWRTLEGILEILSRKRNQSAFKCLTFIFRTSSRFIKVKHRGLPTLWSIKKKFKSFALIVHVLTPMK